MIDFLTKQPGVPSKADAVPGMAHFRGSGPAGTTCHACKFHKYLRADRAKPYAGCLKFYQLSNRHGPTVHGSTPSCKYFKEAPQ